MARDQEHSPLLSLPIANVSTQSYTKQPTEGKGGMDVYLYRSPIYEILIIVKEGMDTIRNFETLRKMFNFLRTKMGLTPPFFLSTRNIEEETLRHWRRNPPVPETPYGTLDN